MKTRGGTTASLLLIGGLVLVVACSTTVTKKEGGGVEFKDDYALIRSAALDKADHSELNGILAKYDKSLYRIHVYEGGKVVDRLGSLSEVTIGKTIVSEIGREAEARGLTAWTVRIGGLACYSVCTQPTPPAHKPDHDAAKKRLVEILRKYAAK